MTSLRPSSDCGASGERHPDPVSDNVRPIVEPDAEQMLRHVQHLFGGDLDGCHEGRIELAWTDFRDGRLRHADIFGTDQLEGLVERAARENRIPGQNLYIGQALRKPDIAPFGRSSDDDFFAHGDDFLVPNRSYPLADADLGTHWEPDWFSD